MTTQRKRGPVPMPVGDKRRNIVQSKVTDAELKLIRTATGRASVSTWIRSLILAATKDPSPVSDRNPKGKK